MSNYLRSFKKLHLVIEVRKNAEKLSHNASFPRKISWLMLKNFLYFRKVTKSRSFDDIFPYFMEIQYNVSRISQYSSKNYQYWLAKSFVLPVSKLFLTRL